MREITPVTPISVVDDIGDDLLRQCGEAAYNIGNSGHLDWERFYDTLDMVYGWDMQDLGGSVDNKIRRIVRKMVTDGEIA